MIKNTFDVPVTIFDTRSYYDYDFLSKYYSLNTKNHPNIHSFNEVKFNFDQFIKSLEKEFSTIENIFQFNHSLKKIPREILIVVNNLILIHIDGFLTIDDQGNNVSYDLNDNYDVVISSMKILYDPQYDKDLDLILQLLNDSKFEPPVKISSVGIIGLRGKDFEIRDVDIETKNIPEELAELHYGDGFLDFDRQVRDRLKNYKKGLFLFHGEPGTGKSYYIRQLIRYLCSIQKQPIYVPNNAIESILRPDFITFMLNYVKDSDRNIVLVLEDAEEILKSRNSDKFYGAINNLLNMTDGILNDMLEIQVISTFNTDLKNIDSALLRSERLLARKEFKKLSIESCKNLANYMDIDFNKINLDNKKEITLSDFYSSLNKTETLVHEYKEVKNNSIGFV